MSVNGHDTGQFEDLLAMVKDIDTRTRDQNAVLVEIKHALRGIATNTSMTARNTSSVADFFDRISEDNRELSKFTTGKWHSLLIAIIAIGGLYILIDKLGTTDLNLKSIHLGEISHTEKE